VFFRFFVTNQGTAKMNINLEQFEQFAAKGMLVQHNWGNLKTDACLISSLAGETSIKKCASAGWPQWLAEIGVWLFDSAPDIETAIVDGRRFALAVKKADEKGVYFDDVYAKVRMTAILPIALNSVGEGNELWRIECRRVVLAAIERVGKKPSYAEIRQAAMAAWAARDASAVSAAMTASAASAASTASAAGAAGAAGAAWAADAAGAADAVYAAWAAGAAYAAWAARAAARTKIIDSLIDALET
jgi:hypothetical protein